LHLHALAAVLAHLYVLDGVKAAVPHVLVDLPLRAHAQLLRDAQPHIHVLLVIADLLSLSRDLPAVVQLALEEDVLGQGRGGTSLKGGPGPVHVGGATGVQTRVILGAGRTRDWGGALIVDSQIIVEGTLEGSRLIHVTEATCRIGNVGVSTTTVVCVVNSLGMDVRQRVSMPLLGVVKSTYRMLVHHF
jgi:hypothetical protein